MSKTFYAVESQPVGCTVHTFESKKDRDIFCENNFRARATTYGEVPKRNDRGIYIRKEHHKKEIPAVAGNV